MIVRPDQQIVIRVGVVLVVVFQVLQRGNLPVVVIAGDGQHGNVDLRKVFLVWNHVLPIFVEARVLKPALQPFVGRAVHLIVFAVRSSAQKPSLIQRIPALGI